MWERLWRGGLLWRGSLPPLGCEAAPKPTPRCIRYTACKGFTTAPQPNGGKPPRHNKPPTPH
ncbi:hypothetical protein CNN82_06065 [Pseudomonas frederiksbergensis]|uniref:Protein GbcA n=1 Tax=Pseudomonas frederiksbergensis TaxID=104087 RepID=A0AB33E7E2_9PSED|nr:hypothetical protein CNN82_06065 [Pseudomonas frederiksbergensis]